MKTNRRLWSAFLVTAVVGVASLTAFSPAAAAAGNGVAAPGMAVAADQVTSRRGMGLTVASTLSDAEQEGLLYMVEEEKLARDVYEVLYDKWELDIFDNIASSEQTHMDAVKRLLDRYDLANPVTDKAAGEFANAELQALYDELIATGTQSLEQALRAGAAIEEIDILDLEKRLAETDNAAILRVYENLNRGSRNHLRAFVSTLSSEEGVTYAPQYMSQEAYDLIVSASTERGGNASSGRGRNALSARDANASTGRGARRANR